MRSGMARMAAIGLALGLSLAGVLEAAPPNVVGTNQRTLVICVRFTNALTTRMTDCSDWVTLLNNETNTFYNRATFNQTNFQFETVSGAGAPANGWFDLSYDNTGYGFYTTGQDAIDLADPYADFAHYDRVLVITSWPDFGGQGGGPWWWSVDEGVEATVTPAIGGGAVPSRQMTLSIVNEWAASTFGNPFDEAGSVVGHELGHQLAAPTHYGTLFLPGGAARGTITPWGIMGLSPTYNHFLGFAKVDRGWIPAGPRIRSLDPLSTSTGYDVTVTLRPLEQTTTGAQVIRIPFDGSASFIGYMVENRRQVNGDERLPSQGVLLSAIDHSGNAAIHAFVLEDPSEPLDLDQAPLEVGETFTDTARDLSVEVLSQNGDDYDVRVRYSPPATTFDPAITPWGAPPWETPDIWVDSERNMFGTYLYTDGSGDPVGNGDDAWVDHVNRVYVRVHNLGTGAASNVRVQIYSNSPPGMGDAGPNWAYLGTVLLPSVPAGGDASGFVNWKPTVGAHTCIKAVIVDTPGELLTTNNLAQENVTHFYSGPGSPYQAVHLEATVYNPYDQEVPVRLHVRDVPYGWAVETDPPQMLIAAHGKHPVHVAVYPSGLPPRNADGSPVAPPGSTSPDCPPRVDWDPERLRATSHIGFLGKPKVEAQVPFYDTFIPIGGIEVWTRLADRMELTCRIAGKQAPAARRTFPGGPAVGLFPEVEKGPAPQGAALQGPLDPTSLQEMSAIVLEPAPVPWSANGTARVEGQLTPAVADAVIAVEVRQGGTSEVRFTRTDAQGRYSLALDGLRGRAEVQTFFDGDPVHAAAESGFCAVEAPGGEDDEPDGDGGSDRVGSDWRERPWSLSLHAGRNSPRGDLGRSCGGDLSWGLDLEYRINATWAAELFYGHEDLDCRNRDGEIDHLSLHGKAYLSTGTWRPFVGGGVGQYDFNPGSNETGFNLFGGLQTSLAPRLELEATAHYHFVDVNGSGADFLTYHLGLRIRL